MTIKTSAQASLEAERHYDAAHRLAQSLRDDLLAHIVKATELIARLDKPRQDVVDDLRAFLHQPTMLADVAAMEGRLCDVAKWHGIAADLELQESIADDGVAREIDAWGVR